jgi:hypothetical protein
MDDAGAILASGSARYFLWRKTLRSCGRRHAWNSEFKIDDRWSAVIQTRNIAESRISGSPWGSLSR